MLGDVPSLRKALLRHIVRLTNKIFRGNLNLIYHSSEKRFQCEVCSYGVNSYTELSRHTYIHKSMNCRDFECEVCKMKYVTLYELKDHQRRTKCLSN